MADIYPTHTCFDDVNDIIKELIEHNHFETLRKCRVVHAVCLLPDGKPYSHGWLEVDNSCWFCGILDGEKVTLTASPISDYHEHHNVQEFKRYTLAQIRDFGDRPPPYEEPFISLCK